MCKEKKIDRRWMMISMVHKKDNEFNMKFTHIKNN
jgi:hypothetical protein